jgi:hypothetical protein
MTKKEFKKMNEWMGVVSSKKKHSAIKESDEVVASKIIDILNGKDNTIDKDALKGIVMNSMNIGESEFNAGLDILQLKGKIKEKGTEWELQI